MHKTQNMYEYCTEIDEHKVLKRNDSPHTKIHRNYRTPWRHNSHDTVPLTSEKLHQYPTVKKC